MSEVTRTVADIFTGKGGTIRLAIFGSLLSAVIYEILDSKYDLKVKTNSGASVSLTPVYERAMTAPLDPDNASIEEFINKAEEKAHITDTSGQSPTESQTEERNR